MNSPTHFRKLEVMVVSLLCLSVPIVSDTYLSPLMGWALTAALMVIYLFFLGRWISGTVLGVLINERNLMSLSRFQMVAWTVLVLSAFFTIALKRLHVLSSNPNALPLAIGMDWHLWTLMGISATSLVGSPLILSTKTVDTPAPGTVNKAAEALNESPDDIQRDRQGTLYSNPHISDASLTDMFQGDEIGNTAYIDVSKLQMFYFSVIAIVAYAYALYVSMGHIYPQVGFAMPVPPTALVALLGISPAAYLTSKTTQQG